MSPPSDSGQRCEAGDAVPANFEDCQSTDQRQLWIQSSRGQAVVARRPRLLTAQNSGNLQKMAASSKWVPLLNELLKDSPYLALVESLCPPEHLNDPVGSTVERAPSVTPSVVNSFPEDIKLKLFTDGYAVLNSHVPKDVCDNALKYVNSQLGDKAFVASLESDGFRLLSHMSPHPLVMSLYNDHLRQQVSELLHGGNLLDVVQPRAGQVALRFPSFSEGQLPPDRNRKIDWHIDGMKKGDFAPFSLLVGVALTDQTEEWMGNLCVFPGSHNALQQPTRNFARAAADPGAVYEPGTVSCIEFARAAMGAVELGEPQQPLLTQGDVVLCHQRLAHSAALNVIGPHIRQIVYFRVSHKDHNSLKEASLDDLWIEFEGMHDLRNFLAS
jgi:hypothetical protein